MISVQPKPIISRILNRKTCATIIITNYAKLPIAILGMINEIAFVTNLVNDGKDFICVLPFCEQFYEITIGLTDISTFVKIEAV